MKRKRGRTFQKIQMWGWSSALCSCLTLFVRPLSIKCRVPNHLMWEGSVVLTLKHKLVASDLWGWSCWDSQKEKREETNRETAWMNRPWSLVSVPSCQSACWAVALWCVDPPVITLYDLLHSKCYINLVTPPITSPPPPRPLPTHTDTDTHPLIMQTS